MHFDLVDLNRWLERRQLSVAALDAGRLRQFQAARRRRSKARRGDPATGQQLLQYLRDREEIAASAQTIDLTPPAYLTLGFEEFLDSEATNMILGTDNRSQRLSKSRLVGIIILSFMSRTTKRPITHMRTSRTTTTLYTSSICYFCLISIRRMNSI